MQLSIVLSLTLAILVSFPNLLADLFQFEAQCLFVIWTLADDKFKTISLCFVVQASLKIPSWMVSTFSSIWPFVISYILNENVILIQDDPIKCRNEISFHSVLTSWLLDTYPVKSWELRIYCHRSPLGWYMMRLSLHMLKPFRFYSSILSKKYHTPFTV